MRILFCSWRDLANPLAGGSEVLIDRLAGGLTERGHDVSLLCAGPVEARDYEVVRSGSTYSQYALTPLHYLARFRDADLVVDVANGMPFFSSVWRRKPSICFVNHVHTEQWRAWFPAPVAAVARQVESRLMPLAYRNRLFIAVSPSTAGALQNLGVDRGRIRLVHNGVDPVASLLPKSPEPLFVALGRLVPHKRYDLLLRVWDRVHQQIGGKLVIAGAGPEQARLAAMAGDGVELVGQVSEAEKANLLGSAWLFLHPSMLEGWGIVIMEAAAAGTPTLGFAVPGVRDSVVHGTSGLLVRSEDELAEEWVALANDSARRELLGKGAQRIAGHYSWSKTVDAFMEVAEEAVGTKQPLPVAPRVAVPSPRLGRRLALSASTPKVTVVVPAFNEAQRLHRSLPQLASALSELDSELIVVDDGSTDDTVSAAKNLLRGQLQHTVVRLGQHEGKGAAVRAGIARARGRSIVFMDADLATDLSHLPDVLAELEQNHVVVGSRAADGAATTGATLARVHMGRTFNRLARTVTGLSVSDFQCGFKAFRAPAAKLLFHLSQLNGFAFDVEILMLASQIGYRITEVPVRWTAVPGGHVRPARDAPAMGIDVIRSRARWTRRRMLAAIEASCDSPTAESEVVDALGSELRDPGLVVPWHHGALGLLPFLGLEAAEDVADRIQRHCPDFIVHASSITARELLAPSATSLRTALTAA